jgi:hypothetical protein
MVCGPSDIARSMISLNFALASATVQLCARISESSNHKGHRSRYSHTRLRRKNGGWLPMVAWNLHVPNMR